MTLKRWSSRRDFAGTEPTVLATKSEVRRTRHRITPMRHTPSTSALRGERNYPKIMKMVSVSFNNSWILKEFLDVSPNMVHPAHFENGGNVRVAKFELAFTRYRHDTGTIPA